MNIKKANNYNLIFYVLFIRTFYTNEMPHSQEPLSVRRTAATQPRNMPKARMLENVLFVSKAGGASVHSFLS